MTVKEIIVAAATKIGVAEEVNAYLLGTSGEGEAVTSELLRCFNHVENELALDYLPLLAEEEIQTETGVVHYVSLSREAARIVGVYDEYGNALPFTLFPEYLKTQPHKIVVRYTYLPQEKTMEDKSDFVLQASVRLFAYGIAAEYSLANGLFEEAAVWDKKYKNAIEAAYRAKPARRLQSRRWA